MQANEYKMLSLIYLVLCLIANIAEVIFILAYEVFLNKVIHNNSRHTFILVKYFILKFKSIGYHKIMLLYYD